MYSINCKGKLFTINEPVIMGIINATPDSFYKRNGQGENDGLLSLAGRMLDESAAILDVGGQSTRPGSQRITAAEESARVLPVIESIIKQYPDAIISIDTYSCIVAKAAVAAGASIVNDISGGFMDTKMLITVADLQVPYVCMHMKGTPADMHIGPVYDNVIKEVLDYFIDRIDACTKAGITDIIIDPGFGFGKTISHNFQLLKQLAVLSICGKPILAGLSRKSTVYKTLDITAEDALNGTTVMNTIALMNGASILRVHDVKEAWQAIQLVNAYKKTPC